MKGRSLEGSSTDFDFEHARGLQRLVDGFDTSVQRIGSDGTTDSANAEGARAEVDPFPIESVNKGVNSVKGVNNNCNAGSKMPRRGKRERKARIK